MQFSYCKRFPTVFLCVKMSFFQRMFSGKDQEDPKNPEIHEGISSSLLPELELDKSDEEILKAIKAFESEWKPLEEALKPKRENNELAWKNRLSDIGLSESEETFWSDTSSDNAIFEAHETFLSNATRVNPEPTISSPNSSESITRFGKNIKDILVFDIERDKLKIKVKQASKFEDLYYVGVLRIDFDEEENRIRTKAIRPHNILLQKGATIEGGVYTGDMLAERCEDTADNLVDRFPKKKNFIEGLVDKKMGTKLGYLHVWTKEYRCFKLNDEILGKQKNPHFNYSKKEPVEYDEENDEVITEEKEPLNHFRTPQIPYLFLSAYSLGKNPFDDTTLFEQAMPYQRAINKRNKQIDENVDGMNGGWKGDPAYFNESTLREAIGAVRDGDGVLCPPTALEKESGNALDGQVYNDLRDRRQRMKEAYGIVGLLPSGLKGENTVRGKIMAKGADGDRISGGIIEYIEQLYDAVFNYWVQMIYVYYTEEDITRILGEKRASEFMGAQAYMVDKELSVGMKEGSLIPKDDLTKRNEAIDRWGAGAIDPITFMKRMDEPDPEEAAYKVWLYQNNPQQYFAEFAGREPQVPPEMSQGVDLTGQPPPETTGQVPPVIPGSTATADIPLFPVQ